jgi:SAM-dependent methyltransferase
MLTQALEKAAATADALQFRAGDAVDPPLSPQSFDVIASRHVFWTLREPERALRNWRALLRPGGRLLIIDGLYFSGPQPEPGPAAEEQQDAYPADVRALLPLMSANATMADVRALVAAAGFTGIRESRLDEVERLEREHGYMFSESSPRYVVTAVAP